MTDEWRNEYMLEDLVNLSPTVNSRTLDKIKLQVENILLEHKFIINQCPRVLENPNLADINCPYYIKAPLFRNCSLIANFFGPFTAREVAYMMDLTIDAVYHIEETSMEKIKKRLSKFNNGGKDLLP